MLKLPLLSVFVLICCSGNGYNLEQYQKNKGEMRVLTWTQLQHSFPYRVHHNCIFSHNKISCYNIIWCFIYYSHYWLYPDITCWFLSNIWTIMFYTPTVNLADWKFMLESFKEKIHKCQIINVFSFSNMLT